MAPVEAFLRSPAATHVAEGVSSNQRARVVSSFNNAYGQPCRVVEQNVTIGGQQLRATGTMCRDRAGNWVLVP
jgi:surface antigen